MCALQANTYIYLVRPKDFNFLLEMGSFLRFSATILCLDFLTEILVSGLFLGPFFPALLP